jgi:hypothetical protein
MEEAIAIRHVLEPRSPSSPSCPECKSISNREQLAGALAYAPATTATQAPTLLRRALPRRCSGVIHGILPLDPQGEVDYPDNVVGTV